ncbi:MAG: hypothetical protein EHM17_11030 [Verrucomicrobiaceae bacterium]|nr:MAG: hypothetical protein EHM17_15540 [Verrucomicrobiaceae bacterium]RPJ33220.1 MAG: hypothetical protein EHM17_11030 [Verrucomicrobiaceae bacterium]
MNKPRTVINLEETIGKQVGRRKPPVDPLRVASDMNQLATGLFAASGHKLPRRGVFRFRTHEEADQWMMTMGPKAKN